MNSDDAPLSSMSVVDAPLMAPRSVNGLFGCVRTPCSSSGGSGVFGVGFDSSVDVRVGVDSGVDVRVGVDSGVDKRVGVGIVCDDAGAPAAALAGAVDCDDDAIAICDAGAMSLAAASCADALGGAGLICPLGTWWRAARCPHAGLTSSPAPASAAWPSIHDCGARCYRSGNTCCRP